MTANHMTPRMFLAKELRRAREFIGMKPDDVAKSVFVSEGLVRSWEKGRRIPQPDNLTAVETLFGPEAIAGILARLRESLVNAALPLEWMTKWRAIEKETTSLLSFQSTVVPGLLQTEAYATAIFRMTDHLGDVEKNVQERLERQQILAREYDPPTMVVVLSEAVLVSSIGGPGVMKAQLEHLIEVTQQSNVFIHVVPFTAGVCAGFVAPFVVASFDGGEVAYVDDQLKAEIVEEPENVAILRRMFERFRAHALSQPDSIEFIRKTIEERWTK